MKKLLMAAVLAASSALGLLTTMTLAAPTGSTANLAASCKELDAVCIRMAAMVADAGSAVEAFTSFGSLMDDEPEMRQNCHIASHNLGRAIWVKFGEESFVPGGGTCAFGIYHGVLQQIASTEPAELQTKAERLCGILGKENRAQGEECLHGIGHALALVAEKLNDAYIKCQPLGGENAEKCTQGATMEWLDRFRDSIALPTEVCTSDILPAALGSCIAATYASELIREESRLNSAGCERFDERFGPDCRAAIGSALADYANLADDPFKYFNHPACASEPDCVGAMVVAYLMNSGSTENGEAMCERFALREPCVIAVGVARGMNKNLNG